MHAMSPFQNFFFTLFLSPITYVLLLIALLGGLFFLYRSIFRRTSKLKADSEVLASYRLTLTEYERWLAGFPEVTRVLENLRADVEGEALNGGTPHGLENCTVAGLRQQVIKIRARSIGAQQ